MKKLYFGSNLKMYKNVKDTIDYLSRLQELTADLDRSKYELFIIPSYTSLMSASEKIDQSLIELGAQNMCWEDEGQFTGEISPLMLKELGLKIVELGHSERRHVFGETDQWMNLKVKAALKHDFIPLLCIGETDEQKEYGISDEVLRTQLKIGFHGLTEADAAKVWVAYEPVWAIGVNGKPATPEYADEKHKVIRQALLEIFGEAGRQIPILYGGSVNPSNSNELIVLPEVDGLFVGRSAWDADKFNVLIRDAIKTYNEKA